MFAFMYVCMYICLNLSKFSGMYEYLDLCIYECMCLCTYARMLLMHVSMYVNLLIERCL